MDTIDLTCPDLDDQGRLLDDFVGDGATSPPSLRWKSVPEGAATLVVIIEDASTPAGPFVHWVAGDIGAQINGIEAGSVPSTAVEATNSTGEVGWAAPRPDDDAAHQLAILLHAVHTPLNVQPSDTADDVREKMAGKVIGRGELIVPYTSR